MKVMNIHLGCIKMKVIGQFVRPSKKFIRIAFLLILLLQLQSIKWNMFFVKYLTSHDIDMVDKDAPFLRRPISGINDIGPETREVNDDPQCNDDATRSVLKKWKDSTRMVCEATPTGRNTTL